MLTTRILTAVCLIPPVVGIIFWGGFPLMLLSLLVTALAAFEFFTFAIPSASQQERLQYTLCTLLPAFAYLWQGFQAIYAGVLLAIAILLLLHVVKIEREAHETNYAQTVPSTLLGFCYPGILGTALVVLADTVSGTEIVWVMASVAVADSFAYFGGSWIGGKKLAPRISPNKTIAGGLCGLLGAVISSVSLGYAFGFSQSLVVCGLFGLLVGVIAIFGDLIESMIKRAYGVKDSGSLLPGHGGVLDRVDAMLFALPLLFFW